MSDPPSPDPNDPGDNPFAGVPFFGDLMRLMGQQRGLSWDAAGQLAVSIATDGSAEANVEPIERIRYEELCRVAELHLSNVAGMPALPTGGMRVVPVNRATWARQALVEYRPLFERLARSLTPKAPSSDDGSDAFGPDALGAMLNQLVSVMGPMMLTMTVGSMVGHLARRALGSYHLPLPRPELEEIQVVAPNVSAFADDWSLGPDDVRLWVCLEQLALHVVLVQPALAERLGDLVGRYVDSFEPDASAVEERFRSLDMTSLNDPASLQKLFGDPEIVLGAVRSARQAELQPQLEALVAVAVGWVDHALDQTGARLLGGGGQVAEAMRRNRVEASDADRFVERLLGLELGQATYDRGAAFVAGVLERAGDEGLARLWAKATALPTPAEVDAPGLWLARIEYD